MQFFFFYFIRNNIFVMLKNVFACDNHPRAGVACHSIWGWLSHAMIKLVDVGYHIVRLSGLVIILFSNSNSCYIWKCYVYFYWLGPSYATRRLHIECFD